MGLQGDTAWHGVHVSTTWLKAIVQYSKCNRI